MYKVEILRNNLASRNDVGMKKHFITGLVTLLPLAVTFWIITWIVRFLTNPFIDAVLAFRSSFPSFAKGLPGPVVKTISQFLILIILFLFTLFLGFIARRYFFKSLLHFGDQFLRKIPLINKVYKTSTDIIHSLFHRESQSFKQVVLLRFPYSGSYCLGLISADALKTCNESLQTKMISVFIPTTPNPTTGYLVMCKTEDLIYLDMKSEDAIKYVVSCAVIQPTREKERTR